MPPLPIEQSSRSAGAAVGPGSAIGECGAAGPALAARAEPDCGAAGSAGLTRLTVAAVAAIADQPRGSAVAAAESVAAEAEQEAGVATVAPTGLALAVGVGQVGWRCSCTRCRSTVRRQGALRCHC